MFSFYVKDLANARIGLKKDVENAQRWHVCMSSCRPKLRVVVKNELPIG